MLSVPPSVKVFLYSQAADLRRGYDGLAAIVKDAMDEDPLSGSLFVFVNKRGNRIKLLYWDRDGYAIWYKRLEKGMFPIPVNRTEDFRLAHHQLAMLLEGMECTGMRGKKRFSLSG